MTIKLSDVKRAYAQKVLANAKAGSGTVVVLPEFMEENGTWVPTESAAIESPNGTKGFGYVCLVQNSTTYLKGVEFDNTVWAIQRGRVESLAGKYKAGTLLAGHIVTEDSLVAPNPTNPVQDLKYISAAARDAKVPCTIDDQPIYQTHYWDPTGTVQNTVIHHNNDVVAIVTGMVGSSNKPNAGIDPVKAQKAARLQQLRASAKLTKAEKLEVAELEEVLES